MSLRTLALALAPSGRTPSPRERAPGRTAGAWRGAALVGLLVVMGPGCAAPQKPATTAPAAASKEHREVAELEKTIADLKAGLHSSGDDRLAAAPAPESTATPMTSGTAPAPRCDGVCRAGQEICTASRRICKIAAQLDEPPVTASCQRAERSCTDASALCAQCR